MSGVYQLCHVFQFIIDDFYDRPLSEKYLVIQGYQLVLHVPPQPRDKVNAVIVLSFEKPLGYISLISKQLAEEVVTEPVEHSFVPIIHIRLGKHEIDQLSTLVAS